MYYNLCATVYYTQISLPTSCTVLLYLLYRALTCFGHISWPSSASYKFSEHVQRVWQLVINDWQTMYVHIYYMS